jgi:FKBP-type peptidyl-prolyl cis-trans isomerase FkpA
VSATPGPATLDTEDQKTLYALGVFQGKNLKPLNLSPAEIDAVRAGLEDEAQGHASQVDLAVYGPKAQNIILVRQTAADLAAAAAQKAKDAPFLAAAAKEPGAVTLPSGVVMKTLVAGAGPTPQIADRVRVKYDGHLVDGTAFDDSDKRGGDAQFALAAVMPCWNEALRKMSVGGSAALVCPSSMAFGDKGKSPRVPPGAALVFNVELLEINPKEAPTKPHQHPRPAP